ncbi:hypothetical protein BGW80DRAFT_305812 [Lactifluus volemus]|nr:hypothetical protein BGW80DRAFT_305812 [Lactifluus volemus]
MFIQSPHPSTPTVIPLQQTSSLAPAPAPTPVSAQASAPTPTLWRDDDSYRSQGHAPRSRHPHSQSHTRSYTHHTFPRGRAQTDRRPISPPHERYRHARPQAYDRDRKPHPSPSPHFGDWDRPPSSLPPPREHFGDRERPPSSFPQQQQQPHLSDRQRPPSPFCHMTTSVTVSVVPHHPTT